METRSTIGSHAAWRAVLAALVLCGLPAAAQNLEGFADMHTHPMSHLGFGGMVVYGAPDTTSLMLSTQKYRYNFWGTDCNTGNELAGSLEDMLGNCNALHGAPGWPDNECGDIIRSAIVDKVERRYIHEYPNDGLAGAIMDHPHGGYSAYAHWPHWSSVTHQQMYWPWIRRAWEGGQRVMVALAVNNSLLAKAGNATQFIDDRASVELQLEEIVNMVNAHGDFMEVALSPADLRRIVSAGRLAVVLGVETDDFGNLTRRAAFGGETITQAAVNAEIQRLHDLGVRYILPIHFANSVLGGYAINEDLFALSSKEYINAFPVTRQSCGEGIQFKLDRTNFSDLEANLLRTRDLGRVIDTQPTYTTPAPFCGHANSLSLTTLGFGALTTMMNLGMMVDIDHMSRLAADSALGFAASRNYPLSSGHNGLLSSQCGTLAGNPDYCNENARTRAQYERIRGLRGMVGLGHGGRATSFVRGYRDVLEIMGNRPVAIGTDTNGLEALPEPDPDAPVVYDASFPMYTSGRSWDFNTLGFAHYGLFPDYIRSWQSSPSSVNRMSSHEMQSFMSSAEQFARTWERSELRSVGAPRTAPATTSTGWCTHAGATVLHGDFNGDGAEDLMCRDPGRIWIDYADNRGQIAGATDWYLDTVWCTHAGATLQLGDFNGDGRTDLLCRDPGRMWIDYASAQGRFQWTDWYLDTTWCTGASDVVHLGDFNGDGRTDLLCRNPSRLSVDYASTLGRFAATEWTMSTGWCTHAGATVQLGDFNGDGRTDLLCRDPLRLWFDYASTLGRFEGTDWYLDTAWCTHAGAALHPADLNGDGRTDLLCRDPARLWADYADASGRFSGGTDWYRDIAFCASAGEQFSIMDMNGDSRQDVVCKNPSTLSVRYASLSGAF